ncbi:NFATC2-interacting protein [Apteryx rowi]|uniref:NFATC2-interacting protein n=1 Tax=Apteryx rowi TaxID=308060 RepID=UPI000E1D096D|nr:NFATC2-interacting protein [Apteryx rowi]
MTEPSSMPLGCPEAVAVGPAVERGAAGDALTPASPPWPRARRGSSDSDSDIESPRPPRTPRPKRRRLRLGPDVPSVPVYSNKVNSCLWLCPMVQLQDLPAPQQQGESSIDMDAEEEEEEEVEEEKEGERKPEPVLEPEPLEGAGTPVLPCSPQPRSGRTRRIIRDVDQRLRGLSSLVLGSPGWPAAPEPDVVLLEPPAPPTPRLLQLKVQCRAELHRVPLQTVRTPWSRGPAAPALSPPMAPRSPHSHSPMAPALSPTMAPHSPHSRIPPWPQLYRPVAPHSPCPCGPSRSWLHRPVHGSTAMNGPVGCRGNMRGLGGCVPPPLSPAAPQAQPLSWLMERYRAARGLGTCPLRFFFDGRRLLGTCTPEELGMEQDDIIEVWA